MSRFLFAAPRPKLVTPKMRCVLAVRVGCPAQVRLAGKISPGWVHAGYFCTLAPDATAIPVKEAEELVYHECVGCTGDHVRGSE